MVEEKEKERATGRAYDLQEKGKGRRMNPTGKSGKPMECCVNKPDGTKCGSVYHLAKDCPHRQCSAGPASGKGNATSTHLAIEGWETEYVQTFEEMFLRQSII